MRFSKQKIFGIDISDASVEVMCLENKIFGRPQIYGYNRIALPHGVVTDGDIRRPEILSEALRHLVSESLPKKIFRGFGIVSLPDSKVFMTILRLPQTLEGQELLTSVLYELETNYPLRMSENVLDFSRVRKDSFFQDIFAAVIERHSLVNYIDVLRHAGIFPIAFDIESLSIARALLKEADTSKNVIIADIGARTTNLTLYEKMSIRGVKTFAFGGDTLTESLASALGISWVDAENLKRKINIYSHRAPGEARIRIEKELRILVDEIKKMIQSFLYTRSRDVDTVILAGGSAQLMGIRKFFQSLLRQNVEIRNSLKKLDVSSKDRKSARFLYFANVVGLALRGLEKDPVNSGMNLLRKRVFNDKMRLYERVF